MTRRENIIFQQNGTSVITDELQKIKKIEMRILFTPLKIDDCQSLPFLVLRNVFFTESEIRKTVKEFLTLRGEDVKIGWE